MFEVPIRALLAQAGMMPDKYNYSSNMKGKQYIYGAQFNITRKINDNFSAAIGIRANYYDGYNRGFVNANMTPARLGLCSHCEFRLPQRQPDRQCPL